MIVSCPNCSTRYVLDATVLRPPGRHVRCARCQTTWFQEPALDLGAEAMIPENDRAPVSDKSRMLPPPARIGAAAHHDREVADAGGYQDRQRDLARDLARDLPRDSGRDIVRDPPQRNIVREALGHDDYAPQQPVTREISRDALRDMGRDVTRRDNDRGRFEPAPAIHSSDIAFDEPVRHEPALDRGRNVAPDPRRDDKVKRSGSSGWLIGGGMILALIAGGAFVADSMHEDISRAYPFTKGIYSLLGYQQSVRGLDFADISFAREIENGVTVLAIRGQIVNASDRELPVPKVEVTVRDQDKQQLFKWSFPPDSAKIAPKSRAPFSTRLESPPPEAWDLDIRFAKVGE
jgi:predicted Zn finger-like uncharacterized protein